MFCTPSPMLDTSSLPRRRRPMVTAVADLPAAAGRAHPCEATPPTSEAAARPPAADLRKPRRPTSTLGALAIVVLRQRSRVPLPEDRPHRHPIPFADRIADVVAARVVPV